MCRRACRFLRILDLLLDISLSDENSGVVFNLGCFFESVQVDGMGCSRASDFSLSIVRLTGEPVDRWKIKFDVDLSMSRRPPSEKIAFAADERATRT